MSASQNKPLLALLLPSKGRLLDLVLTLSLVPLRAPDGYRARFVVIANYGTIQLAFLRVLFASRATFVDERRLKWRGMTGAYNYALEAAENLGASWAALWADDLLPDRKSWLDDLFRIIVSQDFRFGIFSSDEGHHKGRFGWNVFAGYPCAHFYVARVDALPGYFLNPKLKAYVGDNEIAVDRIKKGIRVDLLPIKVIHQPTANATRVTNVAAYKSDVDQFYVIHPELNGRLDAIVLRGDVQDGECRFVVDKGSLVRFDKDVRSMPYGEFILSAPLHTPAFIIRLVYVIRSGWNGGWMYLGRVLGAIKRRFARLRKPI